MNSQIVNTFKLCSYVEIYSPNKHQSPCWRLNGDAKCHKIFILSTQSPLYRSLGVLWPLRLPACLLVTRSPLLLDVSKCGLDLLYSLCVPGIFAHIVADLDCMAA